MSHMAKVLALEMIADKVLIFVKYSSLVGAMIAQSV
jgi:hypothetical protein